MRLESLGSDESHFRRLDFHSGFNLVLADKTKGSDATDSRNGAGKTSVVRLLRYLLGGNASQWTKKLKGYSDEEFWAKFDCDGRSHIIRRAAGSTEVTFDGLTMRVGEWRQCAGVELFGFAKDHVKPTVGQVSGQLIRDDFSDPVKIHSSESDQDAGARIGYYLGLSGEALGKAETAASFEANKKILGKAVKDGLIGGLGPDKAECKSDLATLERDRIKLVEALSSFKVDECYSEHQRQADELSREITRLNDRGVALRGRVSELESASKKEAETSGCAVDRSRVSRLYREVGTVLPNAVLETFQNVLEFHDSVARNRALFLEEELRNAREALRQNDTAVRKLDEKRSKALELLSSSMALEAYTKAQADLAEIDAQIARLTTRVEDLERLEDMDSTLKRMRLDAVDSVRSELKECGGSADKMTALFVSICDEIYSDRKAKLLFEVSDRGVLKVKPEIDGDDSKGIRGVSIFAFDLACVIVGSEGGYIPAFLVHDSHLFDAMDDRQLSSCLNIGARLSREHGFQYIAMLNTDRLEAAERNGFDRADYPIGTVLTDKGESGGLFGVRFG